MEERLWPPDQGCSALRTLFLMMLADFFDQTINDPVQLTIARISATPSRST
ncbi:hypothetical protein [Methylobacterium sp. WL12]|uniref:hypothetical protein n=1 Tax=Methylobacterium sp. WL12 TaxID=2603890 RepID=UPI001650165F|nr:hypothetical protein [Methylobacterium sp. WL12]